MNWQTIESAPKDSRILVFNDQWTFKIFIANWSDSFREWRSIGALEPQPTHWMHLSAWPVLIEDQVTIDAMAQHGGSFVKGLVDLYAKADPENRAKIKTTWPDLWAKYEAMAKTKGESN